MESVKSVTIKGFNLGGLIALNAIKITDETMIALDADGNATLVEANQLMTVGEFLATDAAKHDGQQVFLPKGVLSAAISSGRIGDDELDRLQIGTPFASKNNPGVELVSIAPKATTQSVKEMLLAKRPAPAAQAASAPAPESEQY